MKKILFLLLCTVSIYGQIPTTGQEQEFDYGIKNNVSPTDDNALYFTVQNSDNVLGKSNTSVWAKKIYVDNLEAKKQFLSTGLIKNGLVTTNTPTTFNVTAGIGVISNFDDPENPTTTLVSFPAFTAVTPTYLNTSNITYVAINSTPAIVMQASPFTDSQRRDLIILGAVIHSDLATINTVNNISAPVNSDTNQLHDLYEFIGALNLSGNKYTANGANLSLNKSAGDIGKLGVNFANNWKDPNKITIASGTAITFRYRFSNSNEGADRTALDPTFYEVAGVSTPVPPGRFSIQTVTLFQTGLTRIQPGQNTYATLADARAAILTRAYNVEPNIAANGITRAYIILSHNASSLQNASTSEIVEAQKFGGVVSGGTAVTDTAIIAALGYTPENVANKSDSYTVSSSTTYASTKALVDGLAIKNWIKSNESLSLAQRKGDVLYGILDQYTGEEMTLSKVTGTPTVDGVIYFQLGSEYFKRNNSEIIDLRWFRADNILVQSMLGYSNVKYLVSRDFDLNGAAITIPTGCSLVFKNGVFTNFASITGDFTKIEAGINKIFDLSGTVSGFTVAEAYPEWFGAFGNNSNNDYAPFQKCLTSFKKLYLSAKNYYVSGNLTATQDVIIIGKGAETVVTVGTTGEFLTLGDDSYLSNFSIGYYKNIISNFEINAEATVTTVIKSKGIRWVNYDLLTVRGGSVGIHIIGAFKMSSLTKVDLPHQTTTGCIIDYTNNFVLDQVGIFGNIGGTTGLKITSGVGQQAKNITLRDCDFEGLTEAVNVKGYDVSNINVLTSWFEGNTTDITFDNSLETLTSLNIDGGFFQGNIYLGTVDQTAGTKLINGVTIDNIQIENGDIYVRGATTVQDCSFGSANSFKGSGSIIYADAPHLINPGRGAELPAHDIMPRYTVQPEVAVSTSEVRSSQGEFRYNDNEVSVKTSKGWGFLPILYKEEFAFEALPDTSTIDLEGVNTGSFVGTTDLYNFTGEVQGHIYTLVGGVGCNKLIVHSDSSIKLVDGQNVRLLEGDIIAFQCIGASLVKEVYRNIAAYNYAPRISPAFTGTPTAPTATVGTNTTQIATTAFVQGEKALTVRKISTNTTLADSDNGTIILLTASCTVTLPNGLMNGFNCSFSTQTGATMTYSLGGSVTLINNTGTTMAQNLSHTIVNTGTANEYLTAGSL